MFVKGSTTVEPVTAHSSERTRGYRVSATFVAFRK